MLQDKIQDVFNEPGCATNQAKSAKEKKKGCTKSLKPGAAAGGCAYDGAMIVLQPIADAAQPDAAPAGASDAGGKRTAPSDAGADAGTKDAGTKVVLPPATRQNKPPFAPPQPCLLMPILQERKK